MFLRSFTDTACFMSIYCLSCMLASQILTKPSSPPVTTMTVFMSRLRELVTLMQLIAALGWAYS